MAVAVERLLLWLLEGGIAWYTGKTAATIAGQAMENRSSPSPVTQSQNAEVKANEGLNEGVQTQACVTCQPPQCRNTIENMRSKIEKYIDEMKKYDPVADAIGGFPHPHGVTKPGGHYQEIRDLQRGLKNDLESYNKNKCYDSATKGDKAVRNQAQQISSQRVQVPPRIGFIPL